MSDAPIWQPSRREVNPGQWGVAAPCSSELFKTRDSSSKPQAMKWDNRFSTESLNRTGSSLKAAFKYLQNPDVISLGGGVPLPEYFPFESLELAPSVAGTPEGDNQVLHSSKDDVSVGSSIYDLSVALNYGQGSGSAQLLRWITEHIEIAHDPPYADWQCTMTIGNTSALDMALRMFTSPGHYVLADEFAFVAAVETAKPMGVGFWGVEMDEQGILPEKLAEVLQGWDPVEHSGAPKPFLLYMVPTGHNPTGATQSLERRRGIYRVAQEHNLLILEDDPYYFLQMGSASVSHDSATDVQTPEDLMRALVPSYLSIDTDGRVVRMDSFSKVIGPGLRLGWLTAPDQIIDRYKSHADVSTQGPSGLSQIALFKLLDEHWGHRGYATWLLHLRREYAKRRTNAAHACSLYLPGEITKWETPEAGMFFWVKVDWRKHPHAGSKTVVEIEEEMWKDVIADGALVARGSWFFAGQDDYLPESIILLAAPETLSAMANADTSTKHHVIVSLENFFLPTPVFELPASHTYELHEHKLTQLEQLRERIKDAEILIINRIPLGPEVLNEEVSPNLRMISVTASGTDSVDLEACRRRGITVTNTPRCNTSAVAEHTIGLYFSVRRSIAYSHRLTQASEWPKRGLLMSTILNSPGGKAPRGCKDEVVGILGNGAIGKKIASLATALGMKVLVSGRKGQPSPEGRVPFDQVIRAASVVIVSVPRTQDTINLISTAEFLNMQTDSILINVSRGGVVDEEALLNALEKGQIAGAATDVYTREPVAEDTSPLIGPKAENMNLVTTPHCAWCAEETVVNSTRTLEANVSAWVSGSPTNVVV
ncbi:hypothetical protein BHE90_015295 [Fusarium euwallaceae]|uniref:Aminotransferase class I/classII domain-containing protein n=1 Tax=Fusarium euwallaceae TaxID=1147111 RepID=A0A430L3P3_9HYPO|nr:hypothetical protein BHE90_015295 [Fusarium euwallaceae]